MGKILLFLFALPILMTALVYFWISVKRKWNKEDRLEIREQRRLALMEFNESQDSFENFMRDNYSEEKHSRISQRKTTSTV